MDVVWQLRSFTRLDRLIVASIRHDLTPNLERFRRAKKRRRGPDLDVGFILKFAFTWLYHDLVLQVCW